MLGNEIKRWREVRARARKRRGRYEKKKNKKRWWMFGEVIWQQKRVSRVSVESEKNVSWVSSAGVIPVDIT